MAEPSAKILRRTLDQTLHGEADNIDRLSVLPESVLLSILSRLDLKEAAATSVLSTAWRDLFLNLPYVQLNFNGNGNPPDHPRLFHLFTLFINRILRERNPEIPIKAFWLTVKNFTERMKLDYNSLMMSIAAAMSTCKMMTIDYAIGSCSEGTEVSSLPLPPAMFMSETLTRLRLTLSVGWDLPENVWMPNLRYAYFIPYRLTHENSTQRFLDGCPRLDCLMFTIRATPTRDEPRVKTLRVSSSSLRVLRVGWDPIGERGMSINVKSESLERLILYLRGGHNVNVDAPNLKFLDICGHVLQMNIIRGFPLIDEAVIDVAYAAQGTYWKDFHADTKKASTFFKELQNVRVLSVSEPIIKALFVHANELPTFSNMYKIKFIPDYSLDEFTRNGIQDVFFNLFQRCPNLQVLSFHDKIDMLSSSNVFDIELETVFPITMVQNLKELQISEFKGEQMEYMLLKFFLKNGQSLQIISLRKDASKKAGRYTWPRKQKKKILSFRRKCTKECEIIFK
ncbi:F-box/FBD/LRR-repeat protein At1g16930-like [Vigna unguiculata]|uniref:F-box/FBD/LRR-repeat protein At1g16930-like n=1 Tax=Vigna unguiculata TaxID=3917 RepID=UPI001015F11B|nr:F-box/FBD/LRR-repeat protein At1g16930-like [Vigna unguiculata]